MKVASLRTSGMHAWRVVEHRATRGPQRWRIKIKTQREDGQIDVQELQPAEAVPLSALHALAQRAISDVCAPGEKLVAASLDFYVVGRAIDAR